MHLKFKGEHFWLCEEGSMWHYCYGDDDDTEIVHMKTRGTAKCSRCGARITNRAGLFWRMWRHATDMYCAMRDREDEAANRYADGDRQALAAIEDEPHWLDDKERGFTHGRTWRDLYNKFNDLDEWQPEGSR